MVLSAEDEYKVGGKADPPCEAGGGDHDLLGWGMWEGAVVCTPGYSVWYGWLVLVAA